MKIVRINPDTWDDAAALYAERIDARSHGRGRSDYPDPASALALMRLEYDNFAARFYGANADGYLAMDEDEWPDHAMQWFLKLGALANSSAFAQGYDRYPTATSVLRLLRSKMDDYGYDNIDRFRLRRTTCAIARQNRPTGKPEPTRKYRQQRNSRRHVCRHYWLHKSSERWSSTNSGDCR